MRTQSVVLGFDMVHKASTILGLAMLLSVLGIGMLPRTVSAAATGNMVYSANGEAFFRSTGDVAWTEITPDTSEAGIAYVYVGENGCIVYQGYSGSVYHKSSPTSTADTELVDSSTTAMTSYAINKDCSFVWAQYDDPITYESSIWYMQTPTATPVEYEHNSIAGIGGLGLTDDGGVAYIDAESTLWYRESPTASIQQISQLNEAYTFDINGSGAIAWQGADNIVYYRATPSATIDQISEPEIAASDTVSLDADGGVAFTCNTSAIYYRPAGSSVTTKLTQDYTTSKGILSLDGDYFLHETNTAGLTYTELSTMNTLPMSDDYLFALNFDVY